MRAGTTGVLIATNARARTGKEDAACDDRNLMQPIVEDSKVYVTMGEMCDALRGVWGVWRETPVF